MKCSSLMIGLVCVAGLVGCMDLDQSLVDPEVEADPVGKPDSTALAGGPDAHGGGRAVVTNVEGFLPPGAAGAR